VRQLVPCNVVSNAYKTLLGNFEGIKLLDSLGVNEDNIKTKLKEVMWEVVDWMCKTEDREQRRVLTSTVRKLEVLWKSEYF
jgi:hypothetical protein